MRFHGCLGVIIILSMAYLLSNNRRAIKADTIVWGIGLQLLFAIIILKVPFIESQFSNIDSIFKRDFKEKDLISSLGRSKLKIMSSCFQSCLNI